MKLFLSVFILLTLSTVNAGIYKWTDEKGNVHFGDRPNNAAAKELSVNSELSNKSVKRTTPVESDEFTREEKRRRITDAMSEDREERKRQKKNDSIKRKNKQIQCARMKDKLRRVNRAAGLYNLDKDGNRVFVSHEDKNKSANNLKKAIAKQCR